MIINKYDLELLIATNEELETYVATVLSQAERQCSRSFQIGALSQLVDNVITEWLSTNQVRQLVLVIVSKESKHTLSLIHI